MNPKYVLALLLVLAPVVYGCVNFQGEYISTIGGVEFMTAELWNNEPQETPTCALTGEASSDGLFHMLCLDDILTVTIDYQNNGVNWVVHMTSADGGDLSFLAVQTDSSSYMHIACNYNCWLGDTPDCFVG